MGKKEKKRATNVEENTRKELTEKELENVVGGRKAAPNGCKLGVN